MHRFTYGIFSLGILWACAGGDFSLFWTRQLYLIPVFSILVLANVVVEKKRGILKPNGGSAMIGVGGGVILTVAGVIYMSFLTPEMKTFLSPTGYSMLLASLLIAASSELLFRGLLQPLWGLWSCAFLEAINFGFGAQNMKLFIFVLLTGAACGLISKRFGFVSALIARSLVWLGAFSYLALS
ncbi:hypothetical protein GW915_06195 [bacterium]|nr:hypothetical protein [bacterium]